MSNYNLASIEEIIEEAKQGRVFILVDDENRENEGDLVIPAEFCDDNKVNFMASHGRGLICLALDKARVEKLDLPLMSQKNHSRHQTAFTVSIEAREGVSTGISAADRAKTIKDAIDENKSKYDIVSPGHIFPLVAKEGGVLTRAGHTEAAVDISKLAGLNASGVICEIMNDDGTMARLPDLIEFAKKHDLKIATIADLIEYRRKNEKLVKRVNEYEIEIPEKGTFTAIIFRNIIDETEHLALIKGNLDQNKNPLVRMHQLDFFSDVIHAKKSVKKDVLEKSLQLINDEKQGVIVILAKTKNEFISNSLEKLAEQQGKNSEKSEESNKRQQTIRDYGIGAQILLDLGINEMRLISTSGKNIVALEGYGIEITDYVNLS